MEIRRLFHHFAIMLFAAVFFATAGRGEDFRKEADELGNKYVAALQELATECEKQGLTDEAKQTLAAVGPHDPYKLFFPRLDNAAGGAEVERKQSPAAAAWQEKLARLRHEQAAALCQLAEKAVARRQAWTAWQLILAAIRVDPDNEDARRALGYQRYEGRWHTAYEVKKLRAGQIWDDRFGWIAKADVDRYRRGQRPAGGRWITAAEDARLHRDIHSSWEIETEHYTIHTDHSLEAGVALGAKLESLCRLWRQMFMGFYFSEGHVLKLLSSRQPPPPDPFRFSVVYYRDRDDYNRALRKSIPNIGVSVGFFWPKTGKSYFFAGEGSDPRTIYHEATHQLFHQARHAAASVETNGNFWVVEGIAMYMESLREERGWQVLGGLDDVRVVAARRHLVDGDFYVPLAKLVDYNMEQVQGDPKIASLYSQAAGMTSFLIHYDNGRYRGALSNYLAEVYSGRDDHDALARLTGASYDELDRQYREYLKAVKADEGTAKE